MSSPQVRLAFLLCLLESLDDIVLLRLDPELVHELLIVKAHLPDGHVARLLQIAHRCIYDVHVIQFTSLQNRMQILLYMYW